MKKVMFVCLGNICRSPAAEGVLKHYLNLNNIKGIEVHSSGTSSYHNGEAADPRMRVAARNRGMELTSISQHFKPNDFKEMDLLVAMDESNYEDISALCPEKSLMDKLFLFSNFKNSFDYTDVPDPYYGGESGFDNVLDIIEDAIPRLMERLNEQ